MTDYSQTKAWRRGIRLAADQLALQPADDGTLSVSLDRHGSGDDPVTFKMCLTCHEDRASGRCPHGVIRSRTT